ncbi:MAG TPA: 1-deoxy-D-xylulose-5-phosphate synthase [Candidatus Nanopelagicaceae bacterium]|nr:1-deoxy-D-xylulose-5-phosphate synthase [Candidatus Nanopelagicaceae bacterium]
MSRLESLRTPADLADLTYEQLDRLAQEIRDFLIEAVSKTGGHLGPNLGVVELSIAVHRIFLSPKDTILWDTGHQAYVHKLLTGRSAGFANLRQRGGLSGYPNRGESEHDVIENSHASTALSWADGIARGYEISKQADRHVVAIVGDGALTGGMAWEALNNIAASKTRPLVIVVNDNERSYAPTVGGLANHLATLRTTRSYERFLDWGKGVLEKTPVVGQPIYETLHGLKKGLKDIVAPQGMFEDLGLKYIGPVDGHDIEAVEFALRRAKEFGGPVIVHVITEKGRGHLPAVLDDAERFHAVGIVDPESGLPLAPAGTSWTNIFSEELLAIGKDRPDVVAITAAMLGPTGLSRFAAAYPERTIDVGIAEQYAVTAAAGLAFTGLHPIFAVYATFLNRAFDQLLLDVAMHKAQVTFVLDRAGVTGDDGPSHHGIWDLALSGIVPGLKVAAPRDATTLRKELREAIQVSDGPTLIRFPKGAVGPEIPAIATKNGIDVLYESANGKRTILLVAVGAMASLALEAASLAERDDLGITVVDLCWVRPISANLDDLAVDYDLVVVLEDGLAAGGIGNAISQALMLGNVSTPVHSIGVPLEFIPHSKRSEIFADLGITAENLAKELVDWRAADHAGRLAIPFEWNL